MAPSRLLTLSKLAFQFYWQSKEKLLLHYRVVVLGSGRVGKTSLVRRLISSQDNFEEDYVPTVEEMHRAKYKMCNMNLTLLLELLDTSGSYPFPAMRDLAIRSGDAFLLVYSVDDPRSYEEVIRLKELIYELRGPIVPPVVVVANKIDLTESRVIDTNLVDSIVSIDWELGHVECSAKTNENVYRIFTQLLRQKILAEKQAEMAEQLQQDATDVSKHGSGSSATSCPLSADSISPSRSSSTSEKLFFADDFYGSNNSLDVDSRKSSITDSEIEFRLRNGFKDSNCIIS